MADVLKDAARASPSVSADVSKLETVSQPDQTARSRARFSFPLAATSLLSVLLVAVVGMLIAFMQYQGRLLRAQPGLTAGQLIYYVETEAKVAELFKDVGDLSEKVTKSGSEVSSSQNEIDFRVARICDLFVDDPERLRRCSDFLRRIPFNQDVSGKAGSTSGGGQRPGPSATSAAVPESPVMPAAVTPAGLSYIKDNFVRVMGDPRIGSTTLGGIMELYSDDLSRIARANQEYLLIKRPAYLSEFAAYLSSCRYLAHLVGLLPYRKIEIGQCRDVASLVPAGPVPTPPMSGQPPASSSQTGQPDQQTRAPTATPAAAPTQNQRPASPAAPERNLAAGGGGVEASAIQGAGSSSPARMPEPPAVLPPSLAAAGLPSLGPRDGSTDVDKQRDFELVSHYRFYDNVSFGFLRGILISPAEFLALLLVCFAGMLGALLRVVILAYSSGRDPTTRGILIGPILGLISALVVYVLFRAGFIALTDRPQSDTTSLSPFVVAFAAITAGLLSERAIQRFEMASEGWIGPVDAAREDRWAVGLAAVIPDAASLPGLASRLGIDEDLLRSWRDEAAPVPAERQRELELVLAIPARRLFTDLPPPATP